MPLFGKKSKPAKMSGEKPYPTAQPAYPTAQPAYPTAASAYPPPPNYSGQPQGQYPAPSPYQNPVQPGPYGQPRPYGQPPPGYVPAYPQAPQPFPQQPQQVQGVFDQGARFATGLPVNIPPPPPGVAPTAAQIAAQQGQSVVMTQEKRDLLGGGSDGGYTLY